jgi:uncharacterized membrane protein YjjB (DUF3815 family)
MFLDRKRKAGKHLELKVALFCVAAVVGLAGIYFESRWLTGVAIVLLLAGMFIRALPSARE